MIALEARQLSFRYPEGPLLLDRIDLRVETGECVALTGHQAAANSTLCAVLAGVIRAHTRPGEGRDPALR